MDDGDDQAQMAVDFEMDQAVPYIGVVENQKLTLSPLTGKTNEECKDCNDVTCLCYIGLSGTICEP